MDKTIRILDLVWDTFGLAMLALVAALAVCLAVEAVWQYVSDIRAGNDMRGVPQEDQDRVDEIHRIHEQKVADETFAPLKQHALDTGALDLQAIRNADTRPAEDHDNGGDDG